MKVQATQEHGADERREKRSKQDLVRCEAIKHKERKYRHIVTSVGSLFLARLFFLFFQLAFAEAALKQKVEQEKNCRKADEREGMKETLFSLIFTMNPPETRESYF
jgi:hypothetical protein